MSDSSRIGQIVESKRNTLIAISDQIWEYAELKFEEYRSADLLCKALEDEGFAVERNIDGMETAFIGSY